MEEPKTKQERKAMAIKITTGAGGVGGIVFLGGALVAATLVSAFAYKRRSSKTEHHAKSSPENDVTVHLTTPTPPEEVTDLSSNLEMMMKSSKDHHSQIIKGLTFLLPADSSLPFLPNTSSKDTAAETDGTRVEPDQVLILDDEKAKAEVNSAGYQEIKEESTPLFDDSGVNIAKEEYSFSISEASRLELGPIKNMDNSVGFDQQTICSDGLVPESNGFPSYGAKTTLTLHSEPESINEGEFVVAAELPVEGKSMNKDEFSTEAFPVFAEVVGSQVQDYEPESTNVANFSTENSPVSDEAFELLEEDSEENKAGNGYEDQIEVEKGLVIVQEMIVEDVVQEIAQEDQLNEDKETLENYEEENTISESQVEVSQVKKEGENIDVGCDSIGVREDILEVGLVGEELEEVEDVEENGSEIVGVDQIIAEVNEEVKLIGGVNVDECEKTSMEALLDQVAEEEEDERVEVVSEDEETVSNSVQVELGIAPLPEEEALDLSEVAIKVVSLDPINEVEEAGMMLIEEETEECDDVQGDPISTKCEDESRETANADEVFKSLLEGGEKEECDEVHGDMIEDESMETSGADEVFESLFEESDEVHGDIFEDESLEASNVDELVKSIENGEMDEGSHRLITKQESSDPTVDAGLILESGNIPLSIEAAHGNATPQVESSDDEDGDDEESESDSESEDEESSEGTADLSTESNYDAVWPAETIQQLSFKAETIQQLSFKLDEMKPNEDEVDERVETIVREVANRQMVEPWKVKSWARTMLALLWCLCHWYLNLPYVVSFVTLVISVAILCGISNYVIAKHK